MKKQLLLPGCIVLLTAFASVARADDSSSTLSKPPVTYVDTFSNATTAKIASAQTWSVYPAGETAPAAPNTNAPVLIDPKSATPVTAPSQNTAPAVPPAVPNPDETPNSLQGTPSLQGARNSEGPS